MDNVERVGVVSSVLVEVGVAVIVVVGVLDGLLPPGEDFFGALVGMGVGRDGLVGQTTGLFVGLVVGTCSGILVPEPPGVVWDGWVGNGV